MVSVSRLALADSAGNSVSDSLRSTKGAGVGATAGASTSAAARMHSAAQL